MTKSKLPCHPVPDDMITYVCQAGNEEELDTPSRVSYGVALPDSLPRLDAMHSVRHVAAQQTMSIKIKPEQLPHLLSTSFFCTEQAWVLLRGEYVWKTEHLIVLAKYIPCIQIHRYRMLCKAGICPGLQTDMRIKDILENIAFFFFWQHVLAQRNCKGSKLNTTKTVFIAFFIVGSQSTS